MNTDFKLGIIGGMGPITTAVFIKMIVSMTDAKTDQEHMPMVIEHCPSVPDRTSYILDNNNPDPVGPIAEMGKSLARAGATEIAIPCFTAHYFHKRLLEQIPIPVINGIDLVAKNLKESGVESAGVMATDGTVTSDIFRDALNEHGIKTIYPDGGHQKKVMSIIYDHVKANRPVPKNMLFEVYDHLRSVGAENIILGCTELSVAAENAVETPYVTDALKVLSQKCVDDFMASR